MRRLLQLLSAFALLICLAAPVRAAQAPIHITYIFSDGNIPGTISAFRQLIAERPDLRGVVDLTLVSESTLNQTPAAKLRASNVLVFDTMNEQLLATYDAANKTDLLAEVAKRGVVLGVGEGLLPQETYLKKGVVFDARARAYWAHSGPQNQLALLKLALSRAGVKNLDLPDPQLSIDFGYYYPDGGDGRVFATWDEFNAWRAAHGKLKPGAPRVAIGFFKASYYSGDTAYLDALIAEVERQGGEAIPLFGYPGPVSFQRLLLDEKGVSRADVGLGANFQFVDTNSPKIMETIDIPVINLITLYGRSEAEWRASPQGLSSFEGTFNLAAPELAGTTAPTVVGTKEMVRDPVTGLNSVITSPIKSRVATAVSRALRYAELRRKANAEKRIALLYYNYPSGKANIGASYLNVAESMANVLTRLKSEGYDIGGEAPTADQVLAQITTKARNVMGDAPGELDELLAGNPGIERISMAQYRAWLNTLAPNLKAKMIKDWGEPEKATFMLAHDKGAPEFVVPTVRYGKVILTPQPSRAWGENLEKMYHAKDLAPHHQYFAAYAWLRNAFKADAVVHIGTHGTLEWLDGRDAGLGEDDAPDALIADLPNAYIYNVDVVGEGLVARRRGMATLVDHMVPPFKPGGLTEELAKLSELMNDHAINESKNPELAEAYGKQVRDQAIKLGIAKDLSLENKVDWTDEDLHRVEGYLLELKEQKIPFGLHAFGRTPAADAIASTVEAIVSVDRSQLPDQKKVLAADMEQRITASGGLELDGLMRVLAGRFVPASSGGEPIRNPDAYATGKNFYGIDPDKVPKPAAWAMGTKLAEQMLQDYVKKNGKYPEKVSFVIWGDETMRHEGVLESQIFYLLGTKPVWDARGKVVGVEVIPRAQLGRPRVDIIIASAAEGMFNNVTKLMDQAVQETKALDEADNQVRKHYLATKAALIAKGVKPADADKMAGVRIFDEAPGNFNLNTSTIVANSGSWDTDAGFGNDYIRKMGHGYGNGYWGEAMPDVFRLALADVNTIVHSSSTALYGALDNDDMFMYVGGLAAAVRSSGGVDPDLMVTDTRDPGKPAMTGIDEFIGREFRSRYVNPTWIQGMQKEGYAGAGAMREFVEYMWGWDATVTRTVDDAMWKETFDTYVEDKHNLGMKAFFETKSPFAYQDMTGRMIETVRKGYWNADEKTKAKLINEYIASINAHGVNCTEVSCGNGRMLEYVMQEAAKAGVPAPAIAAARGALEKAMGRKIETAAQSLREFAKNNDSREQATKTQAQRDLAAARAAAQRGAAPAQRPSQTQAAKPPPQPVSRTAQTLSKILRGLVMQEETREPPKPLVTRTTDRSPLTPWNIAWPIFCCSPSWRACACVSKPVSGLRSVIFAALAALALSGCDVAHQVSPGEMKAYEVSIATQDRQAAIAWHGYATGRDAIHFEWLRPNGKVRSAPVQVSARTTQAFEPDLQLVNGAPILAWYEKDAATKVLTAWVGRLDDAGKLMWRRRLDAHGGNARNPVVRVSNGTLHLAWLETARAPDKTVAVWTAAFDLSGTPLSPPRQVGLAGATTWNLNATTDKAGVFHLVYDAALGGKANELQMISINGDAIARRQLTPEDGFASVYPDIGIGPDGQAAVTWFDARDGNEEVYLAVMPLIDLAAGRPLAARRITTTRAASIGAYLAWNGDRLALAWCDAEPGQNEVYLQMFDVKGAPVSAARRLTKTSAQSSIPSIRVLGPGFLIGWNEYVAEQEGEHGPDPESKAMTERIAR